MSAAGEITLDDGRPTFISNESGHYQPGPAYIWQAVMQLRLQGVNVAGLTVALNGVDRTMTGAEFLRDFEPTVAEDNPRHLSFDAQTAVAAINRKLGSMRSFIAMRGQTPNAHQPGVMDRYRQVAPKPRV